MKWWFIILLSLQATSCSEQNISNGVSQKIQGLDDFDKFVMGYDYNDNGGLDVSEFGKALDDAYGMKIGDAAVSRLFSCYDIDKDRKLTSHDFEILEKQAPISCDGLQIDAKRAPPRN